MVSFDWDRGFPSKEHGIFVANSDGTGARRLTTAPRTNEAHDTESQWSPDGRTIVFNSHFDPGPRQSANLYAMRPDGSRRSALTHHHGGRVHSFRPSWAPDGSRIVFTRFSSRGRNGRTDLYTADPDGSSLRRITNLPRRFPVNPEWGPKPSLPAVGM